MDIGLQLNFKKIEHELIKINKSGKYHTQK